MLNVEVLKHFNIKMYNVKQVFFSNESSGDIFNIVHFFEGP